MTRKDSLLKTWWDPAFNKLVNSRAYRNMCNDIDTVHGKYYHGDETASTNPNSGTMRKK